MSGVSPRWVLIEQYWASRLLDVIDDRRGRPSSLTGETPVLPSLRGSAPIRAPWLRLEGARLLLQGICHDVIPCTTPSLAPGRLESGWGETVELMPVGYGDLLAILFQAQKDF